MDKHWIRTGALALALCLASVAALATLTTAAPRSLTQSNTLVDLQDNWSPQTMDPHWMYDVSSWHVASQVYERLVQRSGASVGGSAPALASGWQVSAAADTYTFTIRSGVTFHAGGTLAPHDVAYSFWRALIQDRTDGPMWMWFEPFFGVYTIEDVPGDDLAKCQAVKQAITYDDAAGTVTFHLASARGDLLALLEIPPASILDQEWMAAHGGWAGNCDDWRDYHDPALQDSILYGQANGTGPFRLDAWTGDEVHLVRYDDYWRQQPAWVIRAEPSWAVRRDALLAGTADVVAVPATGTVELDPYLWGVYEGYEDMEPTLVYSTGVLQLYRDLPASAMTPILLNEAIAPTGNPFIGSGALDGNGIPPDFFTDLDVRRGFNYAFDWDALFTTVYGGEALRVPGPIPYGVMGYSDAQAAYPYSPTLAAQALQQAWGNQVWTQGFSLTVPYNEGNATRQAIAELLKQGLEALNPNFHVQALSMPWPDLLDYRRQGMLPAYGGGWFEDYHHPHDWVHPFLHSAGAYAHTQNFAPALTAVFDPNIEACSLLADPAAAHTCYEQLQALAHEHAVGVYAVQALLRTYLRTEVRGYYFRPGMLYPDYYALSKGLPPAEVVAEPGTETTATFVHGSGATGTITVPPDALSETVTLVHTPDVPVADDHPGGFRLGGLTFDLTACPGGVCQEGYAFAQPISLTLEYTDADVAGVIEEEIYLYTWDGAAWVDIVTDCGWPPTAYGRYPDENRLVVPLCHLSDFALVGNTHNAYLPLVRRH